MTALPVWLLGIAARSPATRVPCQLLLAALQFANTGFFRSLADTQSPGSEASAPRPVVLLATVGLEIMLYPGSRRLALALRRSGWSKRTPVSRSAITSPGLPVVVFQALIASVADGCELCRYH